MFARPSFGNLPGADLGQCRVIVVDDDPECLTEYVEMIEGLGYSCLQADKASDALRLISSDPDVGIVVTDVEMPGMDGLTLLEELSTRFMSSRPLVALVVTGQSSLQTAVRAMRSSAMDFLPKPVTLDDLSASLRRASARWMQMYGQFSIAALGRMADARNQTLDPAANGSDLEVPTPSQLQAFARATARSRQSRARFLDPTLFSDPAWDILLDLASAAFDGKPVPVSSVCAATQAPLSTALRYVRQLTDSGLIRSWRDPGDKRRTLVELQPETFDSMKAYLISARRQQLASARTQG